jgi:hypothetical protein
VLCNAQAFCIETRLTNVTFLSKDDIHKYWTIKQIAEKHNIADVFINKIHPLLMSFKLPIHKTPLELTKMKTFGLRYKTCFTYLGEMPDPSTLDLMVKNIYKVKPKFISLEPERCEKNFKNNSSYQEYLAYFDNL